MRSTAPRAAAIPIRYDAQRISEDAAARGWLPAELAKRAGVADMTVYRFLRGERQTAPTAKKLADALGYSVRRYFISEAAAAEPEQQPLAL